jgi:hypothetical protein
MQLPTINEPFQWFWTTSPMDCIMILLVDLYEMPYSEESFLSRAYIDELFTILDPEMRSHKGADKAVRLPLCEGGREAWDLFRELRQKAWQKAGCDPNILWTEALLEHIPPVVPNAFPLTWHPGAQSYRAATGSEEYGQPHVMSEFYPTGPSDTSVASSVSAIAPLL